MLLHGVPETREIASLPDVVRRPIPTGTPLAQAQIQRQILPGAEPGTPTPAPEASRPPVTPIPWSDAEINALSWLCYHEIRGMAEVRIDACLSVISTVRARYVYYNNFGETDVIGTLQRAGQFPIDFDTSQPAPDQDLYWTVIQYQYGARGSCNGFLFYDSVPGGPVLCVIRSSNGQFMEFHNGWN